jgi:hypothetical protein
MSTKKHSSKSTKSEKSSKKSNLLTMPCAANTFAPIPPERKEFYTKALSISCPKCKVGKGHRCIHTSTSYKGEKRNRPHLIRASNAGKIGTKKTLVVKAKVHSMKHKKSA